MLIVMVNLKLHITQDLLCVMIILNHGVSSPLTAPKKGIAWEGLPAVTIIYYIQVFLSILMLVHTSVLDLKYREVDPKVMDLLLSFYAYSLFLIFTIYSFLFICTRL